MYRISQAKDIHKIEYNSKKNPIKLGGYSFNSNYKIVAHSDGDLVLHTLANCFLGAIQKGDIGMYFSDIDSKNKNINSLKILNFCYQMFKKAGFKIENIDMTITCEKIMINPIRQNILNSLYKLLKIKSINIKATKYEQDVDFIQCEAIMLATKGK